MYGIVIRRRILEDIQLGDFVGGMGGLVSLQERIVQLDADCLFGGTGIRFYEQHITHG
ncbi:hypothetical protein D3C72_2598060 [compost metagenome]